MSLKRLVVRWKRRGCMLPRTRAKTDWIIVKGICDWGENKNNPNKKQDQAVAANNAAAFVFHVIRQGGFSP